MKTCCSRTPSLEEGLHQSHTHLWCVHVWLTKNKPVCVFILMYEQASQCKHVAHWCVFDSFGLFFHCFGLQVECRHHQSGENVRHLVMYGVFSYLHSSGVSCRVGAHLEEAGLCWSGLTSFSGRPSLVHDHGLSSKQTHQVGRLLPLHHPHLTHKHPKLNNKNGTMIFTGILFAWAIMRFLCK